ncbi:MAG TPA: hypothetical protein V6D50_10550 [Chroococcales cyanobacterium]
MRKVFLFIVALSTALILVLAEGVLNHKQLMVANSVADSTNCYMQASDGRTIDLGNLCRQPQTNSTPNNLTQFVVNDQVVSDPDGSLIDQEFSPVGFLITWQDNDNQLWIANVDRISGDFIPRSGKGKLVDTGLAPLQLTRNGPEWAYSKEGWQIVYTKLVNNRPVLSRAQWTGSGWETNRLYNGRDRAAPNGSKNPRDNAPCIIYRKIKGNILQVAWRESDKPASELVLSNAVPLPLGRWVAGEKAIVTAIDVGGKLQCAKYDIDTGRMTQLTFDAGQKTDVFMWRAPEFNNEKVFFCLSDRTSLQIYRKIQGTWTKINTIQSPSPTQPYLSSPEPFVYKGKSYIALMTKDSLNSLGGTADIWIVSIDPNVPFYRQVSASTPMNRKDPESFITSKGAFVYYTELTSSNRAIVHRCDTGLGPPQ